MTIEEIFSANNIQFNNGLTDAGPGQFTAAMNQYARQEAVNFAKFLNPAGVFQESLYDVNYKLKDFINAHK